VKTFEINVTLIMKVTVPDSTTWAEAVDLSERAYAALECAVSAGFAAKNPGCSAEVTHWVDDDGDGIAEVFDEETLEGVVAPR